MLKSEVKDLKEMIEIENLLKEDDAKSTSEEIGNILDEENILLKMKKSGFQRKGPQQTSERPPQAKQTSERPPQSKTNEKSKEKEYNCNECDYQGTKDIELKKHINLKHRRATGNGMNGTIQCRNCGEQFTTKWNLMTHRKSEHLGTIAHCRNNLQGKCDYTDQMCWWNHAPEVPTSEANFKCYVCDNTFESKYDMMVHRKKEHGSIIKPCNLYQDNSCRFTNESCWFRHNLENDDNNIQEEDVDDEQMETDSVFQKVWENLKPPLPKNRTTETV